MTDFNDFTSLRVTKAISDTSISSNFIGNIGNEFGRNKTTFSVGDNIDIYADIGANPPTTKIFTGIIEDITYQGNENKERITLTGRDYTARLMDRTVEPEVYTNLLAGSIVKDIINKYTDNITVTNVDDSSVVIPRISFNHTPVYEAIEELSELSGYYFYVDTNKDLHFKEKATVDSGYTFDSGNILSAQFKEERDSVFNEIWVYGDRYLDNYDETFTAGSPVGGSVFTLLYKPHNTDITVGTTVQVGAIYGLANLPPSGTNYLVNYNDRQIVFISGTTLGYSSIPSSGTAVLIKYKRALPIVKVGRNQASINNYGKRVLKIVDKEIKDPETAVKIVNQKLEDLSSPEKEGTLHLKNIVSITPGETCTINLPWHNINNQTFSIIQANYEFNKTNIYNNSTLTIKVNRESPDVIDKFKEIETRLRKLESQDISDSDVITRLEYTTGSLSLRTSGVIIWQRTNLGSSFILGKGYHGTTGPTFGGILGSVIRSGINFLGDSRNSLAIYYSGGYPNV